MNDDRTRPERAGRGPDADGPREGWLDRLLDLLALRSRDTARDDLEGALAEADEASFSARERVMLRNVLTFHKTCVDDVMVPRADVLAVAGNTTLSHLLGAFRGAGHSRLPVYRESLDDPLGMVHIRDVLDHLAAGLAASGEGSLAAIDLSATLTEAGLVRPVLYVPGSMPAIDLLGRMQATRTHIALVIDEHGGTDGLVSIEDLLETVVGDIEDEHDTVTAQAILPAEDGTYLADARAGLDEASDALGIDLTRVADAEEIDTLAGLVVTLAGRVPSPGEEIAGPGGLVFEVIEADPRRLKRLRIHRPAGGAGGRPGAESRAEAPPLGEVGARPDASAA